MFKRKPVPNLNPAGWAWPRVPGKFRLYDKYANVTTTVRLTEQSWRVSVRGDERNITFAPGEIGRLQRQLTMLTQKGLGPASFYRFGTTIVSRWDDIALLLQSPPVSLRETWDEVVNTVALAVVAKAVLKIAAESALGPWRANHAPLIKSLTTKSVAEREHQLARVVQRAHLLPVITLAKIVSILDEAANEKEHEPLDLEGLVALAFMYQHGLRPVQLITVSLSAVRAISEPSGALNCITGFQPAKRGTKAETRSKVPLDYRNVRPEWAGMVLNLRQKALEAGRKRLFSVTTRDALMARVRNACKARGFRAEFRAGELRHSGAQTLADAGHSRGSIKRFLAHKRGQAAAIYHDSSARFGERLNSALAISPVYTRVLDLAHAKFVSVREMRAAAPEQQVGGVVGDRLIAGIGLCKSGQPACPFDPIVSCYGCRKHIPSLDLKAHQEAIAGMREQVVQFKEIDDGSGSPALGQLRSSIERAKEVVEEVKRRTLE